MCVQHCLRFNLRHIKFFYKSKTKIVKRGGKSAIWPNWCCQQSITVLSTPPSSIHSAKNSNHYIKYILLEKETQFDCQKKLDKMHTYNV